MALMSRHLQANAQGAPAALQRSLLGGYMPAPQRVSTFNVCMCIRWLQCIEVLHHQMSAGHASHSLLQRCKCRLRVLRSIRAACLNISDLGGNKNSAAHPKAVSGDRPMSRSLGPKLGFCNCAQDRTALGASRSRGLG